MGYMGAYFPRPGESEIDRYSRRLTSWTRVVMSTSSPRWLCWERLDLIASSHDIDQSLEDLGTNLGPLGPVVFFHWISAAIW